MKKTALFLFFFTSIVWASQQQDFDEATAYGSSQVESAMDTMKNFNTEGALGQDNTATDPKDVTDLLNSGSEKNPLTATESSNLEATEDNAEAIVGDDLFCESGDCKDTKTTESDDFDASGSELAGITSAAEDVKEDPNNKNVSEAEADEITVYAYTGHAMECSEGTVGYGNCCKDNWSKSISHCNGTEKAIIKAKEEDRYIYVGTYCASRVSALGVSYCKAYHETYCIFDSLLSRIMQEDGRKGQLGITFGWASGDESHPNCRGLTQSELEDIVFDQCDDEHLKPDCIDYTEFYATLNNGVTVPTVEAYDDD